jgi:outer membrane protein
VSVETIAGVTQHDVVGAGALAGAKLISNANIIPATVTAKYHVNLGGGVKPYLGAGPSYFIIFGEEPDATARTLGATRVDLSNELGLALQGGIDFALDDSGLGLSLDAKRYFMNTTARFFAGNALALSTKHELDPWVVSAGISYRF